LSEFSVIPISEVRTIAISVLVMTDIKKCKGGNMPLWHYAFTKHDGLPKIGLKVNRRRTDEMTDTWTR
jgi:hypothetical protein